MVERRGEKRCELGGGARTEVVLWCISTRERMICRLRGIQVDRAGHCRVGAPPGGRRGSWAEGLAGDDVRCSRGCAGGK